MFGETVAKGVACLALTSCEDWGHLRWLTVDRDDLATFSVRISNGIHVATETDVRPNGRGVANRIQRVVVACVPISY